MQNWFAGASPVPQPSTHSYWQVARLQVAGGGAWEGMVRMLLVWLGGGALLCAFVLFFGAELVVRVVLGDGYQAAVPVLRVLAIMLPLVAVATVLGFFWALPAGRDGVLLRGTALAGGVNLVLVAGLVPRYEAIGMGVAVVAAEGVMVGVLGRAWWGRGEGGGEGGGEVFGQVAVADADGDVEGAIDGD